MQGQSFSTRCQVSAGLQVGGLALGLLLLQWVAPSAYSLGQAFGLLALSAVSGMLAAAWVARSMEQELGAEPAVLKAFIKAVTAGELNGRPPAGMKRPAPDSLMSLCIKLRKHTDHMAQALESARGELGHALRLLADTTDGVQAGAARQSRTSEALVAQTSRVAEGTGHVGRLAAQATEIARVSGRLAAQTVVSVKGNMVTIEDMSEFVRRASDAVTELGASSTRMSSILQVIQDIADQTNLLALNAAIEAARAGEHGRGFAVVANEVRGLAERTRKSTSEISHMLHEMATGTEQVVAGMSEGRVHLDAGVAYATEAVRSIDEVTGQATAAFDAAEGIAAAVREQAIAVDQLAAEAAQVNTLASQTEQRFQSLQMVLQQLDSVKAILDEKSESFVR